MKNKKTIFLLVYLTSQSLTFAQNKHNFSIFAGVNKPFTSVKYPENPSVFPSVDDNPIGGMLGINYRFMPRTGKLFFDYKGGLEAIQYKTDMFFYGGINEKFHEFQNINVMNQLGVGFFLLPKLAVEAGFGIDLYRKTKNKNDYTTQFNSNKLTTNGYIGLTKVGKHFDVFANYKLALNPYKSFTFDKETTNYSANRITVGVAFHLNKKGERSRKVKK